MPPPAPITSICTAALFLSLAAALSAAALPRTAAAWGHEGHSIVAGIAYARLTPAARKSRKGCTGT